MDDQVINLKTKVAGVLYGNRQSIIARLTGNEPCRLVPEPSNKYDANAIAVEVALPDKTIEQVGYIPRGLAKTLAPLLDGETLQVTIDQITGGFEFDNGDQAALGLVLSIQTIRQTRLIDEALKEPESEEIRKEYYARRYPDDSGEFTDNPDDEYVL